MVVRLRDIKASAREMENRQHMIHEMHDALSSYYKIAAPRTADTIIKQNMESRLLSDDDLDGLTPLALLSPSWVQDLYAEQLEKIAGEDPSTKSQREDLKQMIKELEMGRDILENRSST